jgi:hypothetical protein
VGEAVKRAYRSCFYPTLEQALSPCRQGTVSNPRHGRADPRKLVRAQKSCSASGRINTTITLGVRAWTCAVCYTAHDRDINAAKNVLVAGLAEW